ncbi:MAG: hypothetical protein EXS67_00915 [Candidatus Margulisbacteria bacterium]|nr:hypothetical protein [Candidatus Margulisiibacteriota bacterium]
MKNKKIKKNKGIIVKTLMKTKTLITQAHLWIAILFLTLLTSVSFATTPMVLTFQATLARQQGGLIQGRNKVTIGIYPGNSIEPTWIEPHNNVLFINGSCSIILGNIQPLTPDHLNVPNPRFGLKVGNTSQIAYFPVPSTPYSIQSKLADSALSVSANNISGTFTNPVRINANLTVGDTTLYANPTTGKVGIGTTAPTYKLDVAGIINATGFKINGIDLESSLSWQKKANNALYYTQGNVGIATQNPKTRLEVAGTINAQEIRIKGVELSILLATQLAWREGARPKDIYFNDGTQEGNVGIGTSIPRSKLDVAGAIRVGEAQSNTLGSIQYKNNDFQGFTKTGWTSFASLSGIGAANQIPFWTNSTELSGSTNLVWDRTRNRLGIGTNNPTAQLSMTAIDANRALVRIDNSLGKTLFYVGSQNVGIGTSTPNSKLTVKGVVDAEAYLVKGVPIAQALSSNSFWVFQNDGRIYYDKGNVGIGTINPKNLLELAAAPSRDPIITFDIASNPAFSLGISASNPNAFILGKGGDLKNPIFVFNGNKIGVGLTSPSANLHVSGNSGVLFTGTLNNGTPLGLKGEGTRLVWHPGKAAFRAGYVNRKQWDEENIGLYSVAMGYNPSANGLASVAAGGYESDAGGNYAVVAGGFKNKAKGIHSFAAGHQALALHAGSFVWSDYSPTASETSFKSVMSNQFVIRATNGVGIGTNLTAGNGLTVASDFNDTYIVNALKPDGTSAMIINVSGNVGLGTTDPGIAKLAVMNGKVGIGTTTPIAQLTLSGSTPDGFQFVAYKKTGVPAFFIKNDGRIGIGKPLNYVFADDIYLAISGAIVGNAFAIQNPNGSQTQLESNPGSPWAIPSENLNSTFFNKGFVGIGTKAPASLLELSNAASSTRNPVITFDTDGVKRFSLGTTANVFTIQKGGTINSKNPLFALTDNGNGGGGVGIGIGYKTPSASLHVSGNSMFTSKVVIATTNTTQIYDLTVEGAINVKTLFINGDQFIPQPNPWKTNELDIYYPSGNVGIGTRTPSAKLEVIGTVSANQIIQRDAFILNGNLTTNKLRLKDTSANVTQYGELAVTNEELIYIDPARNLKVISSPLRRNSNAAFDGKLAYWIDNSTVGVSNILWKHATNELVLSGNLVVNASSQETDGFTALSHVSMGLPNALEITSTINHGGDLRTVRSYTGQNILVNVQKNWGNINSAVSVKGLDIIMQQTANNLFLNKAKAIGLNVDMSRVNVDVIGGGKKAAAIFTGGFVGIGTTNPKTALEVVGTVSANYFNLTGGLTVPELFVNTDALVAYKDVSTQTPRVGIGTTSPRTELDIIGTVSANVFNVANTFTVATLNVNKGALFVNSAGNIGIGTTQPNGQIELKKILSTTPSSPFFAEKIGVTIDGAGKDQTFAFNKNLSGLDITLDSETGSQIGNGKIATGVSVNLTNLELDPASTAVGLNVNVTGTTGKRFAAIFTGGRVGIGVTQPLAELHVSGSIKADNLVLEGTLEANIATFNRLTINQTGLFNNSVTINTLTVLGKLSANSLVLSTPLIAGQGTFSTLNAQVASFNKVTLNTLTVNSINGSATTATLNTLTVTGKTRAQSVIITKSLTLTNATMNINNNTLVVTTSKNVGIGTRTPLTILHVENANANVFSAENNNTWNTIRIQNNNNAANSAASILLVPDERHPSFSIGSGISAVRSNSSINSGSDLVFVTDRNSSAPVEGMRITEAGNIGIGTSTPKAQLDVQGTAWFNSTVTINGTLGVGTLNSTNNLTINTPRGKSIFQNTVSANASIQIQNGLFFKGTTPPTTQAGYGALYMLSTDKNLYYQSPAGTSINLTAAYTGRNGIIPFFNAKNSLDDTAPLYWNNTSKTLTVGTGNIVSNVKIVSVIDNSTNPTEFAGQNISLEFGNRTTASTTVFSGLNIQLKGQTPNDPFTFGRLAQNEVAIGLNVDVSNLAARRTNSLGNNLTGFKYAAIFTGGSVGIGNKTPIASLHITTDVTGNPSLIVDSKSSSGTLIQNALVVSSNSFVGIGTAAPLARLHVVGSDSSTNNAALRIVDTGGSTLLIVKNNGNVGIGKSNPQSKLDINGTLTATTGSFDGVTATTLNVGNGNLFVNASGNVGIGTITPTGNINFFKRITSSNIPVGSFTSQKMDLIISGGTVNNLFSLNKDITGINLSLSSEANNVLAASKTATGIKIDMSPLKTETNTTVTGLDIDVTGTTGTRYAALFQGGNVGIGLTQPTTALHVSGNIKTTSLISDGSINVGTVTANSLHIAGDARFTGSVTINTLEATTVSANNLTLTGTLTLEKANLSILTGTTAKFTQLGIGVSPNNALDVSGNLTVAKGRIGIGITAPTALLHLSSLNQNALVIDVKNSTTTTRNVLLVNSIGYVGISTANPSAKLSIVADNSSATNYALKINNLTKNILTLQNDGNMGVGTANPQAILHTVGTASTAPLRIDTNTISFALVASQNGRIGVGTANPQALLHIVNSNISPFKVGTATQPNALLVDNNGRVGIGSSSLTFPLNVSGNMLLGSDPSGSSIASWISSSKTAGVLASRGTKYAFFGAKEKTSGSNNYNAVVSWKTGDTLTFENSTNPLLYIQGNGQVGIGSTSNAQLNVSGNSTTPLLQIGTASSPFALIVSGNGRVGIATSNPSAELAINGTLMAKKLTILSDTVSVSTLNVTKQLTIFRTITNVTKPATAQSITLNLGADVANNIVGLDINLKSSLHSSLSRNNALYNANAYGLKVDMTNLEITDPTLGNSSNGNKYAATFTGGAVGIGTSKPSVLFQVIGAAGGDIAQFGTLENAALTIQDVDTGLMRINLVDQTDTLSKHETLVFYKDIVGIGTNTDTIKAEDSNTKLLVNGDVRVGVLRTTGQLNMAGVTDPLNEPRAYGAKLYFSGAADVSTQYDNDNNSPLWMARYNRGNEISELRVNVGNGDGDKFVVGTGIGGSTFKPILIAIPKSTSGANRVGITDGTVNNFTPTAPLHVIGSTSGSSGSASSHLVVIENTGGASSDSLVIWHNGYLGSPGNTKVPTTSNFITFMDKTNILGEIEGSDGNGVRFKTAGADYAEYLPKIDPAEKINKGDIVGVFNGKISKNTDGATQIMVHSTAAGVAGNWPGKKNIGNYELIAFFGQVKVNVTGPAHKGDFILPSNKNDGTGIAVPEQNIHSEQISQILGRVWEDKPGNETATVLTAVGFNFSIPSLRSESAAISTLKTELENLQNQQQELSNQFEQKLEAQNKEIDALLLKLKK